MTRNNDKDKTVAVRKTELYFATVPIYRITHQEFLAETERLKDKYVHNLDPEGRYLKDLPTHERFKEFASRRHDVSWRFNEIIGNVRLRLIWGRDIGGDLWWNTRDPYRRSRQVRAGKRTFQWIDHKAATPVAIEREDSNSAIFSKILEFLNRVRRRPDIRRRYVDSSEIEAIGPYVDWRAIIGEHWPIEESGDWKADILKRLGYRD